MAFDGLLETVENLSQKICEELHHKWTPKMLFPNDKRIILELVLLCMHQCVMITTLVSGHRDCHKMHHLQKLTSKRPGASLQR